MKTLLFVLPLVVAGLGCQDRDRDRSIMEDRAPGEPTRQPGRGEGEIETMPATPSSPYLEPARPSDDQAEGALDDLEQEGVIIDEQADGPMMDSDTMEQAEELDFEEDRAGHDTPQPMDE